MSHIPVLVEEVVGLLSPRPGENFIDATCGNAGHSQEILKHSEGGRLLCVDLDEGALGRAQEKLKDKSGQIIFVQGNFADIKSFVEKNNFGPVDGILADLGMSSDQLDSSAGEGRGFSFLKNEPLDMRFNINQPLSAFEIVNQWPEDNLEKILREYGEERSARRIAHSIIQFRKIKKVSTTGELLEIISRAILKRYRHGRIHFATRTFQALRIAVNNELANLQEFLIRAVEVLAPGGRLAVISFHSLEDRIVKNFFREKAKEEVLEILTKKPITPSDEEVLKNPRSRSAKLRAAKKS